MRLSCTERRKVRTFVSYDKNRIHGLGWRLSTRRVSSTVRWIKSVVPWYGAACSLVDEYQVIRKFLLPTSSGCLSWRCYSRNIKSTINKVIILPAVLYGCETWSLVLREERRLRVFENRVLRKIFGPKRIEVRGKWRIHNEDLYDLYSSPNFILVIKSRRIRWAGHVARMGERRGVYCVSVGSPERKKPIGRPWHRWEDSIKIVL